LKDYNAKRDFDLTPEPKGSIAGADQKRFVVQHHFSRHEHFDFRLEMNGVLLSWAVPKGLPQKGEKRLAIRVEDHPIEYQYFAGTIPEGQYGAGKVEIFDAGTWEDEDPNGDKEKIFKFKLNGKVFNGSFVLFHTNGANWLFKR